MVMIFNPRPNTSGYCFADHFLNLWKQFFLDLIERVGHWLCELDAMSTVS